MTPNKLPPLPELEEVLDLIGKATQGPWAFIREKDTDSLLAFGTDSLDIDRRPPWYSSWSAIEPNDGRALIAAVNFLRNHGESVAEALRQSQSLPAGAVAGLVGKWRDRTNYADTGDEVDTLNYCADELEQALQADAREKGEAVVSDAAVAAAIKARDDFFNNPSNYHDCPTCNGSGQVENDWCPKCGGPGEWSDITDEDGMREAIKAALATQPAQASEKDNV